MRIGIDARFFGSKEKGLGVYTQKLVENLEKNSDETHQFFIFLSQDRFDDFQPRKKNFHKVKVDFRWYGWKEQLVYPFFLKKYQLDLMHFCHFNVPLLYRKKFVVTIHDLILFHFPTFRNSTLSKAYYLFKLLAYRLVIKSALKRASKIIAISKFTKKDLVSTLKVSASKIKVIYQGLNFNPSQQKKRSSDILKKYDIIKPYILYIGNAYPHKNLRRLVQVFSDFRQKENQVKLVLAGDQDYFYNRLKKDIPLTKRARIIFPGFIEDSDLATVYQESAMVIFPSLYEGFGFPPLEALVYGKKVACSNSTSMPEVLSDAVEYFDPEDSKSMLDCLERVFQNRNKKNNPEVLKIVKKFNWDKTVKNTLKLYQSVGKSKK